MLRKHHKFRQGHKVGILMRLWYYWPQNNDHLNFHTNPHNISVTQQRSWSTCGSTGRPSPIYPARNGSGK